MAIWLIILILWRDFALYYWTTKCREAFCFLSNLKFLGTSHHQNPLLNRFRIEICQKARFFWRLRRAFQLRPALRGRDSTLFETLSWTAVFFILTDQGYEKKGKLRFVTDFGDMYLEHEMELDKNKIYREYLLLMKMRLPGYFVI